MTKVILASIYFLLPVVVLADTSLRDNFVPLVGIPGLTGENLNVNNYIDTLYILAISLAAFLAVARLIWAGLKYMLSDVVPQKEEAKKDIRNAFIGLGIVLGAVLILQTINPQLTQLGALNFESINTRVSVPYAETIESSVSGSNIDEISDTRNIDPENLQVFIANCTNGGGRYVQVGTSGRCLGNESNAASNNTINTQDKLDSILAELNLNTEQATAFAQNYNQFIGTQEPDNVSPALIDQLKTTIGADEVIFVVTRMDNQNRETTGINTQQQSLCQQITGADNFVIEGNYGVCVR